jgi:hypothetical protein
MCSPIEGQRIQYRQLEQFVELTPRRGCTKKGCRAHGLNPAHQGSQDSATGSVARRRTRFMHTSSDEQVRTNKFSEQVQAHKFRRTGSSAQVQAHKFRRTGSGEQVQANRFRRTGSGEQVQANRFRRTGSGEQVQANRFRRTAGTRT